MRSRSRLAVVFCLGSSIVVVQLIGAWLSGSLALAADAVHVFADVFGIGLAYAAVTLAARPTKPSRTFGQFRLEVLATVANGLLLLALAAFILWQAIGRWFHPVEIAPGVMIAAAGYGTCANLAGLLLLRRGSGESLTVKGAYLEVLSDMLGSIAVIIAGVVVLTTGYERIDSILSAAIAVFMVPRTLVLLRRAFSILMEHAPVGLDLAAVRQHLLAVAGVVDVHDLHAWTITSGMPSLSAHVVIAEQAFRTGDAPQILRRVTSCVHECFEIGHTTFQLESTDFAALEDEHHR